MVTNALVPESHLDLVQATLSDFPQADAPVEHIFSPKLYTRVVKLKANTLALGHHQKSTHLNTVLSGSVVMFNNDATTSIIKAPIVFVGKPGRKFGYVLEDTVWLNIYPNPDDIKDIEKLEEMWLDKILLVDLHLPQQRPHDRDDYLAMCREYGYTEEQMRRESEIKNVISLPDFYASKLSLRPSGIEGLGMFLSSPVDANESIAPAMLSGQCTQVGRYINHAKNPNCFFTRYEDGNIWLVSREEINGCIGGNYGEELTVDYRKELHSKGIKLWQV